MAPDYTVRRAVGIGLRLPIILVLGWMWLYVLVPLWALVLVVGLAWLVLVPLCYAPLALAHWLVLALINSSRPVLPHYWDYYPRSLAELRKTVIELVREMCMLGFPTLYRWLLQGIPIHKLLG